MSQIPEVSPNPTPTRDELAYVIAQRLACSLLLDRVHPSQLWEKSDKLGICLALEDVENKEENIVCFLSLTKNGVEHTIETSNFATFQELEKFAHAPGSAFTLSSFYFELLESLDESK